MFLVVPGVGKSGCLKFFVLPAGSNYNKKNNGREVLELSNYAVDGAANLLKTIGAAYAPVIFKYLSNELRGVTVTPVWCTYINSVHVFACPCKHTHTASAQIVATLHTS